MKMLKFLMIGLFSLSLVLAFSEKDLPGLQGKVTDAKTGESIPYAVIILKDGEGNKLAGTSSDVDGNYIFNSIPPGTYTLQCSFVGYAPVNIKNLQIFPDSVLHQDFKLREESEVLQEVVITYEAPLIDKTKTSSVTTRSDITPMAVRDISSTSSQAPSVTYDAEESINIRGSRSEGTVYFIDGVQVHGNANIPRRDHHSPDRESYSSIEEIPFRTAKAAPLSTFSSDVDVASYANIRRFLNDGYLPPADAVRIEEMINYFRYDYPQPEDGEIFSMTSELGICPWNEKNRLLRIGIKTADVSQENLPDNNLVFLIDVSGSMSSHDKLPLLQKSMKLLVDKLREDDKVAIVVYAGAAGVVLEPTKGAEKKEIMNAINNLVASGSTAGGAGLQMAYKLAEANFDKNGNNRVILATDGDFNVGPSSDEAMVKLIEEKRRSGVFLTVLGFGTGNLQDSKMEKLANHGNGNYAYIDNLMEAHKVLVMEIGSSLHTVAKDTKFQIEFNPSQVQAYRLIGYENRMLRDEDFNDDTKDAGDVGSGHSVTAIYEIITAGTAAPEVHSSVDPLKYQNISITSDPEISADLATLKIRYKHPDEDKSTLRSLVIKNHVESETSVDFKFVCAVMQTGMLLRNSDYKGDSSFENALLLAKAGKGEDAYGYRGEFIRMIDLAEKLDRSRTMGVR